MADRSAQVIAVAILFLVLTWLAVGLRIYCRTFLIRCIGNDDKVMGIVLIYGGTRGIGLLDVDLTPQKKLESLKLWWILELLNVCSTCLLKISVGYFLLRVAIERPHILTIWLLMAGTVVFGTTYLLMVAFQCRPVPTYWEQGPRTPDKCWPRQVILIMTIAATVINTSADFIFGTLPWFIVRSMNLPLGTKIVVVDETTTFAIWSTVEPGVGIIAASIATLRPLYKLVATKIRRTNSSGFRRDQWRQRQQARRNETIRQVRAAHNLDPENPPPTDADLTSPHGIFEVNPPPLPPLSKNTNSTLKSRTTTTDGGDRHSHSTRHTLTLMEFPSALRLSDDFRRTMQRPPEEWLAILRAEEGEADPKAVEEEEGDEQEDSDAEETETPPTVLSPPPPVRKAS
ncbi:hypothetical protein COL154_007804 [Colletotrichum chrysophilum]|uniref:uncharacterized protein n=1 Tax=Colletotrichum chrysophilum TaxID=1836956 RepID=UPI002301AC10|nr:uncharacterized protein COL26b_010233 [Colletotrichum chrysophilum]KAJ0360058.1 hypothetical protein COL154_007804 [Colletotrichum chrysophilum]KAJ0370029.1 hypothetical protein COL26b_010233 [Colletotrichum chrysophilum]